MNRYAPLAALVFAAAFVSPSNAAVQIVGSGPEKACYDAAKIGKPNRQGLTACNMALESGGLSVADRAATFVNRSVLLLARGRTRAALADTDAALALFPAMPAASVNRAAALLRLGRFDEARSTLDVALPDAKGIDLTRGLFNRAVAREALGDTKGAYADFKRIVELDPEFEDARLELARFTVTN